MMSQYRLKKAGALRYQTQKEQAPRLVAFGTGYLAEKILQVAAENDVPLYHDQELISLLESVEIGSEIPQELYFAVAEILAFVYSISQKKRD